MSYTVKFTSEGPCGWVYYREDDEVLPFFWQTTTVGFDIILASPAEWSAFCDEHKAVKAKQRRDEIVSRLAKEVKRKQAGRAKVSIDDTGISFSYVGNVFRAILEKVLGLD